MGTVKRLATRAGIKSNGDLINIVLGIKSSAIINSQTARQVARCNQRVRFESDESYAEFIAKCEADYQETIDDFTAGIGRF